MNTLLIYRIAYSLALCFVIQLAQAQEQKMKPNTDEVDANFLFGYYQQDGNNGAVTGGIGTERLSDAASLLVVNVPLDSVKSLNISVGADYYTSASTDNIDNNVSSESVQDIRAYMNIGYNKKNLATGETVGAGVGFSAEYDYTSVSARLNYTKEWNQGNSELSVVGQAFIDRWMLIYPIELRGEVSVPTADRQSFNFQMTYSQVLTKRLQMLISAEAIYMRGLLSTPFHRVYFADQTTPDIERLPDTRLKIPAAIRLNYYPIDNLVVRSYYRYYWDDFGIRAHTAEIELGIKVSETLTINPFYRYHTQTAADYFAPYATHLSTEQFYTSDFDLSELSSHKFGVGITYAPLYGISRFKVPFTKKLFMMDKMQIRAAYYDRSTGLKGFSASLNLGFKMKDNPNATVKVKF